VSETKTKNPKAKMNVKIASEIVGGLSRPSKMPGFAYSIPAEKCKIGSKLRKVKNSVCEKCYALKGRYAFPKVKNALQRRLESISDPRWVDAMAFLVNFYGKKGHDVFRWHDSGDLQSVEHLRKIFAVCEKTPGVKHWLPTREWAIVREAGEAPRNLNIRLSAYMVGSVIGPETMALHGSTSSAVMEKSKAIEAQFHVCHATTTDVHECGSCRACWLRSVPVVVYAKH
jgi:hypothetical protein